MSNQDFNFDPVTNPPLGALAANNQQQPQQPPITGTVPVQNNPASNMWDRFKSDMPSSLSDISNWWSQGQAQEGQYQPGMNMSQYIDATGGLDKNINDAQYWSGMAGTVLGPGGSTADELGNLVSALQGEHLGVPWEQITGETGWARNPAMVGQQQPGMLQRFTNLFQRQQQPYGRMMSEFSDAPVQPNPAFFNQQLNPGDQIKGVLGNVMPHQELFSRYPGTEKLPVHYQRAANEAEYSTMPAAAYHPPTATREPFIKMRYYEPQYSTPYLRTGYGADPFRIKRDLLHEIGHHVSGLEGYAGGANSREVGLDEYFANVGEHASRATEEGSEMQLPELRQTWPKRYQGMMEPGSYPGYRERGPVNPFSNQLSPGHVTMTPWDRPLTNQEAQLLNSGRQGLIQFLKQRHGY